MRGTDVQYIWENNKKAGPNKAPCLCCLLLSGLAFYAESGSGTPAKPLRAAPLTSRSGYKTETAAAVTDTTPRGFYIKGARGGSYKINRCRI